MVLELIRELPHVGIEICENSEGSGSDPYVDEAIRVRMGHARVATISVSEILLHSSFFLSLCFLSHFPETLPLSTPLSIYYKPTPSRRRFYIFFWIFMCFVVGFQNAMVQPSQTVQCTSFYGAFGLRKYFLFSFSNFQLLENLFSF